MHGLTTVTFCPEEAALSVPGLPLLLQLHHRCMSWRGLISRMQVDSFNRALAHTNSGGRLSHLLRAKLLSFGGSSPAGSNGGSAASSGAQSPAAGPHQQQAAPASPGGVLCDSGSPGGMPNVAAADDMLKWSKVLGVTWGFLGILVAYVVVRTVPKRCRIW